MKFIKTVSFLSIMTVAMSSVSYGAPMTAQIRRLLEEKEEKIKQLEQCDGKRKGWMIAGISTIGLTAVGVGVNIAQSSKSNKLSDQIDNANQELQRHETHLGQIQSQISEKEREKAEAEKAAREEEERLRAKQKVGDQSGKGEDDSGDSDETYIETQENSIPEPDTTATTVKGNEINKQTSETGGRVIGDKCNSEDIKKLKPYGWVSGTYIQVGEKVKTTLGARCKTRKDADDNVNCSCRADECDASKNFERTDIGLCEKKNAVEKTTAEKPKETSKAEMMDATSGLGVTSTQTSTQPPSGSTQTNNAKSSGSTGTNQIVEKSQEIADAEKEVADAKKNLENVHFVQDARRAYSLGTGRDRSNAEILFDIYERTKAEGDLEIAEKKLELAKSSSTNTNDAKSSASSSTSSGVNTGGTKSKISDSNGKSFTEADWDKKVSEFNNKAQQRYLLKTQVTHDPTVNAPGVYTKSYDRATQKDYDDIVNEINKMDKEITVVRK